MVKVAVHLLLSSATVIVVLCLSIGGRALAADTTSAPSGPPVVASAVPASSAVPPAPASSATSAAPANPAPAAPAAEDWRLQALHTPPPRQYVGGDLWTRDTLTGDWGGARNELARHGITVDFYLAQMFQGIVGGGRNDTWRNQGNDGLIINFDTGKMGLWPGGFLKVHAENSYGNAINRDVGALMPVNTSALFPSLGENSTVLSEVVYAQFLSPEFGIVMGKMEPRENNVFASDPYTQFSNLAFNFNPACFANIPAVDFLGAGFIAMPTDWLTVNLLVLDPEGSANTSGFDDPATAFQNGVSLMNNYEFKIKPFGQEGHQRIGWTWSDRSALLLNQGLGPQALADFNAALAQLQAINAKLSQYPQLRNFLLQQFGATAKSKAIQRGILQAQDILAALPENGARQNEDWSILYDFDQFLYTVPNDPKRGFGIFGRFGFDNGNANLVQSFYSFGVGGKGIVPGRPRDSFGVGYYYMGLSDQLSSLMKTFVADEKGVEFYYNIAVTPWMHITPDLQVIEPTIRGLGPTTVMGVRMQIDF